MCLPLPLIVAVSVLQPLSVVPVIGAEDDTVPNVKEGQPAPGFELAATGIGLVLPEKKGAKSLRLADFRGKKNVVLYFYPRAMTGGCTKEACGFRDRFAKFSELGTVVLGISSDTLAAQTQFTDKEHLNHPLLADPELKAIRAYGVKSPTGNVAQRKTFVIDKQGIIRKIYEKVNPVEHGDQVLEFIRTSLAK